MKRALGLALAGALAVPSLAFAGSGALIDGDVREYTVEGGSGPSEGVTVKALRQPGDTQEGSDVSDSSGEFSFNVDVGEYRITYDKVGFLSECRRVTAVLGETTTPPVVTMTMPSQAGSAFGQVTNSVTNDPVSGATVEVNFPDSCAPPASALTTDASGNYDFPYLPANNSYYFTFSAPGYNTQTTQIPVDIFAEDAQINAALEPVDGDPPRTSIDRVRVKGRKAIVKFSAVDPAPGTEPITFECKLDRRAAKRCEEPKAVFKNLKNGKHRVSVVATDGSGNTDPSPATERFEVG